LEYTGYVVDNYCWDQPNHQGIDNTPLGSNPENHILHCMVVSFCKQSGFVMLERLGSPASDGSLYGPKYQLDNVGDELVVEMVEAEMQRGGDYQFDVKATVTGILSGNEIAVSKLCITPTKENPSESTICHEAPPAKSTTTIATTSAATSMATSMTMVFNSTSTTTSTTTIATTSATTSTTTSATTSTTTIATTSAATSMTMAVVAVVLAASTVA